MKIVKLTNWNVINFSDIWKIFSPLWLEHRGTGLFLVLLLHFFHLGFFLLLSGTLLLLLMVRHLQSYKSNYFYLKSINIVNRHGLPFRSISSVLAKYPRIHKRETKQYFFFRFQHVMSNLGVTSIGWNHEIMKYGMATLSPVLYVSMFVSQSYLCNQ